MPGLPYPESSELIATTQAGLYEVFGEDSFTAKLLLGKIIGRATLDGLGIIDLSPEVPEDYGYDQPPRYAERAIRTNDPEELAALIGEAADRLSKSLPDENVRATPEQTNQDDFNLYARRMHGNGTGEDESLGSLRIHLSPPKSSEDLVMKGHHLAKLEYTPNYDGTIWPPTAQQPVGAQIHRLTIFQRLLTDPITKKSIVSTNVHTGYELYAINPKPFYAGYGIVSPIDAKIKATMLYYLDEAITYYEALGTRTQDDQYPAWIHVEPQYRTMIYEYLSRLQDVIAYESNSISSPAAKLLASRP